MGCFHSQSPSVEQLQNTEALSDEYVEKVTHISADITEIIKKNKRQPGEGSKDVRGSPPDQSPCPVVRVHSVTDSYVLPHKQDLSPAVSDSLDISRTPVKGILKSRPVTPCPEMFDKVKLFEKSKEVADSALNIINPYRKYVRRQKHVREALSWWEDKEENPDIGSSKRKILSFRRMSDTSVRLQYEEVNNSFTTSDSVSLPSQQFRKWKKASAKLSMALVMMRFTARERTCSDPEMETLKIEQATFHDSLDRMYDNAFDDEDDYDDRNRNISNRKSSVLSL